jgi:hypothetical protein
MYRIVEGIVKLLRGREEGFGWTILLAVGTAIVVVGVAVYGAVQAGGAMNNYSKSSHQAEQAFSSPATPQSNEKLDEIQHTHRQGGLPVMTPVLESGIRAQGAGGPQNFGISYTIGRWIASGIEWAINQMFGSPQTTPAAGVDDLGEHTNVSEVGDDAAAGATGGSSGSSSGSGGCSDGH